MNQSSLSTLTLNGCLKKQTQRHSWRELFRSSAFKKKVRFDVSVDKSAPTSESKKEAEESYFRQTFFQAEDLLCAERYPPYFNETHGPFSDVIRPAIPNFDTRCQGLVQGAKLASRLHPELPPLIVVARVWREFPIRRHSIPFDLGDLRAQLFTNKKRREPDKLKWLLLLLNRILMSEPSYDHEQFLGCLHRMRRVGIPPHGSNKPNFFAFTPAIWSAEDLSVGADEAILEFVDDVSNIYNPEVCGSAVEKQIHHLLTRKMRRAMRLQCIGSADTDEAYLPSARNDSLAKLWDFHLPDSAATTTTTCPSSDGSDAEDMPDFDQNSLLRPYKSAEWLYTVDCCEGTITNVSSAKGSRMIASIPPYLLEGSGVKLHDIRQFKLILRTMRSLFPESVALRLLLDAILDLI